VPVLDAGALVPGGSATEAMPLSVTPGVQAAP